MINWIKKIQYDSTYIRYLVKITQSRMVIARGWEEAIVGRNCLTGIKFWFLFLFFFKTFKFCFFFLVISTPNMELELTTTRSTVPCSSNWASKVPLVPVLQDEQSYMDEYWLWLHNITNVFNTTQCTLKNS